MTVILLLAMILLFLGIDYFVQRKKKAVLAAAQTTLSRSPMRVPSGIFFAPTHTWLNLFPSGNVRVGADDFVLRMMKKPAISFLKVPGSSAKRGEALFQLKEGAKTLTVQSPIDGEVVAVNEDLQLEPEKMKDELFVNGWAYTMKPQRTSELAQFLLGERSRAWIQQELGRLKDFIAGSMQAGSLSPVLLQDGGAPVDGLYNEFTPEQCEKFEHEFLTIQ
jgi:glycine cleavage system H protein